jgi:hypothetical protein
MPIFALVGNSRRNKNRNKIFDLTFWLKPKTKQKSVCASTLIWNKVCSILTDNNVSLSVPCPRLIIHCRSAFGKHYSRICFDCRERILLTLEMHRATFSTNHLGLQKLLSEPTRLLDEAHRVNADLESLIIHNYKVFVENLTCNIHLQSQVGH